MKKKRSLIIGLIIICSISTGILNYLGYDVVAAVEDTFRPLLQIIVNKDEHNTIYKEANNDNGSKTEDDKKDTKEEEDVSKVAINSANAVKNDLVDRYYDLKRLINELFQNEFSGESSDKNDITETSTSEEVTTAQPTTAQPTAEISVTEESTTAQPTTVGENGTDESKINDILNSIPDIYVDDNSIYCYYKGNISLEEAKIIIQKLDGEDVSDDNICEHFNIDSLDEIWNLENINNSDINENRNGLIISYNSDGDCSEEINVNDNTYTIVSIGLPYKISVAYSQYYSKKLVFLNKDDLNNLYSVLTDNGEYWISDIIDIEIDETEDEEALTLNNSGEVNTHDMLEKYYCIMY